jgi:hypothetical protein
MLIILPSNSNFADSPNAASAGCSRSATVGTPRFRRAMTTEVPDADGHEMMVVSKSRMQSAKRRRSMWAERYSNQQWAQITLVGSDRPELASANESLGGAGGSRNGSKNNSMDRPAGSYPLQSKAISAMISSLPPSTMDVLLQAPLLPSHFLSQKLLRLKMSLFWRELREENVCSFPSFPPSIISHSISPIENFPTGLTGASHFCQESLFGFMTRGCGMGDAILPP